MKLNTVTIENYRAIERFELTLDPRLTVLHGDNGHGKTSVLNALAVGLGSIPTLLPEVSGIGFRKTDRRGWRPMRVELSTTEGIEWDRQVGYGERRGPGMRALRDEVRKILDADMNGGAGHPLDLPIVAFYDTDRAVFDVPQRRRGFVREFSRYQALEGAFSVRTTFRDFFIWFYSKENEELRSLRRFRDFHYQLNDLGAVRRAIERMMPNVQQPRIETSPLRFVVTFVPEQGDPEDLEINQLSGGYRIVLALVADLARRMALGNPHLEDPLESEAIVLIDEVDLHLHPSWQQRVLPDLMQTFPNTQFIVSTHSPQVLTTVKPEHVVELHREGSNIVACSASAPTYGAQAGDVLSAVMKVDERPIGNEFVTVLEKYMRLVDDDLGESEEGKSLRKELENLSPRDPALDRADIEMWRRWFLQNVEESH